jgi:hypothetical protein
MARAIPSAAIVAAVLWTAPASALDGRDSGVVIRWPNPAFPTLQEALDAAPDGATVRIAAGVHRIPAPLFVRDKGLTIEGAGCDERPGDIDPGRGDGGRRPGRVTHLVGTPATEVVPAESAAGLLNYVGAGGILKGVKLSGFDAGIVGRDHDGRARPLRVDRSCVVESGRGVLWLASALLNVNHSLIKKVLWNGMSVVGPPGGQGGVHLAGVGVAEAGNSCAFFKNTSAFVQGNTYFLCGGSFGLAAIGSSVIVNDSTFQSISGPGIYLEKSFGSLNHNTVGFSHVAGILLIESGSVSVFNNEVFNSVQINGGFGDGILAFLSDAVLVSNKVHTNFRAGLMNFASIVVAQSNQLSCNGFDMEGEPLDATPFHYYNAGDNGCGCPIPSGACVAQSVGLQAPAPIESTP